jgi:hypothetical protein
MKRFFQAHRSLLSHLLHIVPFFFFFSSSAGSLTGKMDTHVADEKLKELHVEDTTVKANRDALQYEIDPVAEKKLLRKIDLHVVPILWFLFMYVSTLTGLAREGLSVVFCWLTCEFLGSRSWIGLILVCFLDVRGDG